jgi:nucleoside-diphosphate-sugar epimerase
MRVLFIGGTGEISFDCVRESMRLGHDVTVFNRGHNNAGLPPECHVIIGDLEDDDAYRRLAALDFDVVCQFRLFTTAAMARDIRLFTEHTGQYVFISSASVYRKPVRGLPITESTPLENPYWEYSRAKADMEGLLRSQTALPYTIIRPSHTYRTKMPAPLGGAVSRMLRGAGRRARRRRVADHHHAEDFASPVRATARRATCTGRSISHHQ